MEKSVSLAQNITFLFFLLSNLFLGFKGLADYKSLRLFENISRVGTPFN